MNEKYENYKERFLKEYLFEKVYIDEEELKGIEDRSRLEKDNLDGKTHYYRKVPVDISNDELNTYINMKILVRAHNIEKNIGIIRNILICWTVPLIILILYVLGNIIR